MYFQVLPMKYPEVAIDPFRPTRSIADPQVDQDLKTEYFANPHVLSPVADAHVGLFLRGRLGGCSLQVGFPSCVRMSHRCVLRSRGCVCMYDP